MSKQFPYSFGKYQVEAEIGRGGFGNVFHAIDQELDRSVAIKILDPMYMRDQRWVRRFRREARVMARLEHPNIVPIYEIGEQEGRLFLAMRLIDGPNLSEVIKERGPLSWDESMQIVSQLASALDFAHDRDVIHRDLKPGNILISDGQALLTDFGLAQLMANNSQSISVTGGIAGTYNYMPPEIFMDDEATPAADIYALGCVIYEMLVGEMLFGATTTAAIIGAHLEGVTLDEPLPDAPPGTREILQTALAKDPADRYTTAGELAQELQQATKDRLAEPYSQLEQALAAGQWPEALALAAEIREHNTDYRDVVALEEQARTGHWSARWREEAETAVAEDDFGAARGALLQWQRMDPDSTQITEVKTQLTLAEKYVALQGLINDEKWQEARSTANEIYTQDPEFRDIVELQVLIRNKLVPVESKSERLDSVSTGSSGGTKISAAALNKTNPPSGQSSIEQVPATSQPPSHKKGEDAGGMPGWIWWVGAAVVLLVLAFGIRAAFFGGEGTTEIEVTRVVEVEVTRVVEAAGDAELIEFAGGGDTLGAVQSRGNLICANNENLPGFGFMDEEGSFSGFDWDFCRTIAAATLGDAEAVEGRPTTATERFPVLQSGEADVLVRNTTWTTTRDTALGFDFVPITFYDGQGMLVRKASGITELTDIEDGTVCVQAGTINVDNLADVMRREGINYEAVLFPDGPSTRQAYDDGRCDGLTTDKSSLVAIQTQLTNPEEHTILEVTISKQPLGPLTRHGDNNWNDIITWVVNCTIQAEELDITSENVDEALGSDDPDTLNLLGVEGDLGQAMGINNDFCYQVIKQVGNYGEIYNRNLGPNTQFNLPRGFNELWTNGGLLYSPPFR